MMIWPTGFWSKNFLWALFLFVSSTISAQSAREVAVELQAAKNVRGNTEVFWKSDTGVLSYYVYKRIHEDSNWIFLDSFNASQLRFVDSQSQLGRYCEYRVAKRKNNYSFLGNGYIRAGFDIQRKASIGLVLVAIDTNYSVVLKSEIAAYLSQLEAEGFEVRKKTFLRSDTVTNVKNWVYQQWQTDSMHLTCLVLLGHLPVPYSGDLNPDGHADHRGAWPADNYYGSFQVNWTDNVVNRITASRIANRNAPGDGKFDVTRINPVGTTWKNTRKYQLPVGRIDFFDMPDFGSDTILMKRYLKKNLAFRTGVISFPRRALVDDNFGYFSGEAFASGGYRNFSTFFGDSIFDADYAGNGNGMKDKKYLWSYGCGSGSYTGCGGVSNSNAMVQDSLLNPFTMLFGSYFGDWDNRNNFLRTPLASKGWGLVSVWSGRPYWLMHPAALGAHFFECIKTTYNCANIYTVGAFGSGHVHVALMGDPTLKIYPVGNVQGLVVKSSCDGRMQVKWSKSLDDADSVIIELKDTTGWKLLGEISGQDTQFNTRLSKGIYTISVRQKKFMESASGTWWDYGARGMKAIYVDVVDTLKIRSSDSLLCVGDTFFLSANSWKGTNRIDWYKNGEKEAHHDSFWLVKSIGQGNVIIQGIMETDSGCKFIDQIKLRSIPKDSLFWTGITDSSVQVRSVRNLPIRWYFNDTLLDEQRDTILKLPRSGIVRAVTLNEDICEASTDTLRVVVKKILNPYFVYASQTYRVSPNPAADRLTILGAINQANFQWQIINLQGSMLKMGKGNLVDVGNLSPGIYFLVVDHVVPIVFIKE